MVYNAMRSAARLIMLQCTQLMPQRHLFATLTTQVFFI